MQYGGLCIRACGYVEEERGSQVVSFWCVLIN